MNPTKCVKIIINAIKGIKERIGIKYFNTIVICAIVVFLGTNVYIIYGNQIDEDTVCYKSYGLFDYGTSNLDQDSIVQLTDAKMFANYSFSPVSIFLDGILSFNETVDTIKSVCEDIKTIKDYTEINNYDIYVPKEAFCVDTTEPTKFYNSYTQFYRGNVPYFKLYSWEKDYSLKGGKKIYEGNLCCSIDGIAFWFNWQIDDDNRSWLFSGVKGTLYRGTM
jgi:hypothetical protein